MSDKLTIEKLLREARIFAAKESKHADASLYGVTDGKAVGTYFEHKFKAYLGSKYSYIEGNAAKGIDFPGLKVDMKVTSIKQPQSSCPFKSARQKIYGLGYSILVFVYDKEDDPSSQTGKLDIQHVIYIEKSRTADYQTTSGLLEVINNSGNQDDVIAFLNDRMLPIDEIQTAELADEILAKPPKVGYLTISNALQWRLHYSRVIEKAGTVSG
ncbi:MAG: restriction endonuclease, partial [Planctomycetes bacterium]|nr:restriction endonuclease [Planctomycetota bacterium]